VNEHDELVYLLTSKAILLELKYLKNLTLPENATDFGEVAVAKGQKNSMHYHKKTKTLYLLNGKGLFVMQPKKNATACTPVKGFVDG
jgi:oxalate decarboxylase/phosphoglucose isomerase-like protein (cupin superfamily)